MVKRLACATRNCMFNDVKSLTCACVYSQALKKCAESTSTLKKRVKIRVDVHGGAAAADQRDDAIRSAPGVLNETKVRILELAQKQVDGTLSDGETREMDRLTGTMANYNAVKLVVDRMREKHSQVRIDQATQTDTLVTTSEPRVEQEQPVRSACY